MLHAIRRALSATEAADERIMAMRELERCAKRLFKAGMELRRVCQTEEADRDRKYQRVLREETSRR